MTIAEKITNSRDKALFTLYKEGMFYSCYNEDAMVLAKRLKPYRISTKCVKSVGSGNYGFGLSD